MLLQYSLYYSLRNPLTSKDIGHEERFNSIGAALSRACSVAHQGGKPTQLMYDNAVLFNGEELRKALAMINGCGSQPNIDIGVVQSLLPQILSEQLARMVKSAHEHFGAVAVYRDLLEDLYQAADEAVQKKDLGLLHTITGKLAFWYVPTESDVRQWGKDFLHAYRRDARWLHYTKSALDRIKTAVKRIDAPEGSQNAQLKQEIIEAAEDGLIPHI